MKSEFFQGQAGERAGRVASQPAVLGEVAYWRKVRCQHLSLFVLVVLLAASFCFLVLSCLACPPFLDRAPPVSRLIFFSVRRVALFALFGRPFRRNQTGITKLDDANHAGTARSQVRPWCMAR